MSEAASRAVFLSYASQDADAAKKICDALRAAGVEVWFDQSELVGGDAWDAKIKKQIRECVLFVPIISPATNARAEGYFRREWKQAVERTHDMADDVPFLFPIVIGDITDATARVPDKFREVQWTRLKLEETAAELAARIARLLARNGAGLAEAGPGSATPATRRKRDARWQWWMIFPIVGTIMGLMFAAVPLMKMMQGPSTKRQGSDLKSQGPAPVQSEARQLAAHAAEILGQGDLTRAQLEAAEELCARALQLDPTDAKIWTQAAAVDLQFVRPYQYDQSDTRRQRALSRAARAISLAPASDEARAIQAAVFAHAGGSPALLQEAEKILRDILAQKPDDKEIMMKLAEVMREEHRFEEAAKLFEQAGEPEVAGWSYFLIGQYQAAYDAVNRALAQKRTVTRVALKALIEMSGQEDLDAAQATIDQLKPSELLGDMAANVAAEVVLRRRDSARLLQIMDALPVTYLSSAGFRGPKEFFTGWARALAGHSELARIEWQAGLGQVRERLKAEPRNRELVLWVARLNALLEEKAEAERALQNYQMLAGLAPDRITAANAEIFLLLGRREEFLAWLLASGPVISKETELQHADLRFLPVFDPLRGDPRFEKLLRDTLPKGAKPFDEPQPRAARSAITNRAAIDQKSVAVLAFANLSDDKANEYFSDGISEELLNVLVKIPDLKVAARTSAFYFKGKEVPIPEIARQLGVAYVVEGSVRKQDNRVRITAQLIKAEGGFHVWSDTFTRDLKDIFAVQDEIAGLIARNISPMLNTGPVAKVREIVPGAYQEYLLGRSAAAKATMTDLRESLGHFERAVAIEPKFTAAWVQLANAHTRLGRWGGAPAISSWQAARAAIDRAVALEPDSPEVLVALGWILRTGEWKWREAERAFRRALELRPNQPDVLAGAAVLFYNIGQTEEAMRLALRAAQLDPLNAGTQIDLSIMFYLHGDLAQAETAARRALQLAPEGASYHAILAWSLIDQKRFAEAEVEIALDPDPVEQPTAYAHLALARGDEATARKMVAKLEELARTNPDAADLQQSIAWICAGLGEKENDRSFAALERAKASRDPSMAWLLSSRYLLPLHSDPRWEKLKRSMGLTEDQLQ